MTNEQLAILLNKYISRMEIEIASLSEKLPPDMERREVLIPILEQIKTGDFICLDGLHALRIEMQDDLAVLLSDKDVRFRYSGLEFPGLDLFSDVGVK